MTLMQYALTGLLAMCAAVPVFAAQPVTRHFVVRGDARLEVLAQGQGPLVVLLPSLGRGAHDFDAMVDTIVNAGFRVLRPEPRGIGQSTGPWENVNLQDLAADIAAVIEHEKAGPAFVVGHAFGNRVARMLATDRPDLVKAVSLIAANVGRNPSPPNVRAAIRTSADLKASDEERVKAMQFVFFAPGSDARVWLTGWHPEVLAGQRLAGDRTSRELALAGSLQQTILAPRPFQHLGGGAGFDELGPLSVIRSSGPSDSDQAVQPPTAVVASGPGHPLLPPPAGSRP